MFKISVRKYNVFKSKLKQLADLKDPTAVRHLEAITQEEEQSPIVLSRSLFRQIYLVSEQIKISYDHMNLYFQQNPILQNKDVPPA